MGLGLVRVELGERERERLDLMLTHTTQKHMNKHGLSLSLSHSERSEIASLLPHSTYYYCLSGLGIFLLFYYYNSSLVCV